MSKFISAFLWIMSLWILQTGFAPKEKPTATELITNPAAEAVKGEGEWWMKRHQVILNRHKSRGNIHDQYPEDLAAF